MRRALEAYIKDSQSLLIEDIDDSQRRNLKTWTLRSSQIR